MEENFNDVVFGKTVNDKLKAFEKAIQELEDEYAEYFKTRESKFELEKHDKIGNHYMIWARGNGEEVFAINEDSDIDEEIKIKLRNIYKGHRPLF